MLTLYIFYKYRLELKPSGYQIHPTSATRGDRFERTEAIEQSDGNL